ncbi:hypothetical protein EDB85DRAFT_1895853 [Lactarius pseudohatsudake]|nr:hypothetical protein EDB85DRAFT_1895853 [Lactarius pseudohatsudake]
MCVAGSISSGSVLLPLVGNRVGWRRGRQGRVGVAGLSFIRSWLWSNAPYARFVIIVELPDSPRFQAGGPYNVAPYLFLRRRPLMTLGHLPPTAVVESQWGEPRLDASGTSSILTWHHYGCQVGEEEGGVGQEWQAFSSLSLGRGAMVSIFPPPDSPRRQAGGTWSVAPCLFLCRHPLTTLGHPPPTTIAELQWGEPRSDAFGTGARVAVSISLWPILLPISEKRKAGQGGSGKPLRRVLAVECRVTDVRVGLPASFQNTRCTELGPCESEGGWDSAGTRERGDESEAFVTVKAGVIANGRG